MEATPHFSRLLPMPALCCASAVQLPQTEGVFSFRGGGPSGSPPSTFHGGDDNVNHQPPIAEVVGAGAVGVVAGHLVFSSLLVSVGLGATVMGVAASSGDGAGAIARSSGKMAVAAFDRTTAFNDRFQVTDKLMEGAKTVGCRLSEFDQKHAVVHRTTEGAKKAWFNLKQYDEAQGLTKRAGEAMTSGLDKIAALLTPSPSKATEKRRNANANANANRPPSYSDRGGGFSSARTGECGGERVEQADRGVWWRGWVVKGEAGRRRWMGGVAGGGGGRRWRGAEMSDGGRGVEGRQQWQSSESEEEWGEDPPSWGVVWGEEVEGEMRL
ncbi:unnamed protein product [Pylaiella littoralis]